MTREDVIARVKTVEPALRVCGLSSLYLYGSYGRDEASLQSDGSPTPSAWRWP